MTEHNAVIPVRKIESRILVIRGQKVMLDADLAELYGVTTKRLNEQVRRNRARFPKDFMFKLTAGEKGEVVANCDHLNRLRFSPVLPNAFTEHGAVMAASVLNTQHAIQVSVFVVRAFVKMREILLANRALATKLAELEKTLTGRLDIHERAIVHVLEQIMQLLNPPPLPEPPKKPIGFLVEEDKVPYFARIKRNPKI